jgi:epoxyqueuosine reductase QueG
MAAGEPNRKEEMLTRAIQEFVRTSEQNSLMNSAGDRAWAEPLVGFCRGDDPLFEFFKNDIGPFYWTPLEIFSATFPQEPAASGDLTIISWILPQMEATKADHRKEKTHPAERWTRARHFGEKFNELLRRYIVNTLSAAGHPGVAPMLSPLFAWRDSPRYSIASNWSERHAAFACGLGTFGLCDALITPVGKAVRCGSVVAKITLPATPRPYTDIHAYCLYYSQGTCGECMKRCPVGAIGKNSHDKVKCKHYLIDTMEKFTKEQIGIATPGCGLCQVGVPCESGIPRQEKTIL